MGRESMLAFCRVDVAAEKVYDRRWYWRAFLPRSCSLLTQQSIPFQEEELCRWLVQTDIRLSAYFSMDMQNAASHGDLSKAEIQPTLSGAGPESGSRSGSAPGSDGDGSGDLSSNSAPHGGTDEVPGKGAGLGTPALRVCRRRPPSGTLAEPPPPGPISQKFAAQILPDVNLMLHATQR